VEKEGYRLKCPICGEQAKRINKRDTIYKTTHRYYECKECLTPFQTTERIDFNSIPKYLRDRFLEVGKFK
jgi:transcriptional regulator NrdR family protein